MSRAVELMTPLSLVVEDGDGEGAGDGVLAAEEHLLSSNRGLWCDFREAMAAAAYGLAAIMRLFRNEEACPPNMTGPVRNIVNLHSRLF